MFSDLPVRKKKKIPKKRGIWVGKLDRLPDIFKPYVSVTKKRKNQTKLCCLKFPLTHLSKQLDFVSEFYGSLLYFRR